MLTPVFFLAVHVQQVYILKFNEKNKQVNHQIKKNVSR